MKSIDLKMTSVEVKAETRPLCVQWTREMSKDFLMYYTHDTATIEAAIMKEWSNMARTSERKSKSRKIFES
jgi:hypothetical protein